MRLTRLLTGVIMPALKQSTIEAGEKILEILKQREMTYAEICKVGNLHKNNICYVLAYLESQGYMIYEGGKKWQIKYGILNAPYARLENDR